MIVLYHESGVAEAVEAHFAKLRSHPGLRGLTCYHVLDQGPAPNSTVPHLAVTVGAMAQAWFDNVADAQAVLATANVAAAAVFMIEEHRLM